jgi:iron complex transport system ATP-binding protein
LLLRDGRILAQGAADAVLTSEAISACFDHPITIAKSNGRWFAQAAG